METNPPLPTYPFPLNFYRELCYEMNLEPPEKMSEDEEKGLKYLIDYIILPQPLAKEAGRVKK